MEKVKRTAIIDSVIQVVAEHGFHGASMAMISGRAGVATGTIYRYFESKEVLITDAHSELENRICKALLQNYKSKDPILQRYIHLGRGLLSYFIDHPLHFRYLEQFRNSPYGVALRTGATLESMRAFDIFRKLFEEGVSKRVMKDIPVRLLFAVAVGPLFGAADEHILGFINLDDTLIHQTVETCWNGIRSQA